MSRLVGRDVARVEGRAKVTGAARYAADQPVAGVLRGFLVLSTVARGEVTRIDTGEARGGPGVVAVYTHRDMPRLAVPEGFYVKGFLPMQDARVYHNGQPVALVVAETFEQARDAAARVRVEYRAETPVTALADAAGQAYLPPPFHGEPNEVIRGDTGAALAAAPVRLDVEYRAPAHHHNPIEPHATTAVWDDGRLTVYESAQGVNATRQMLAAALGVPPANVRVISEYLGGGFGAKGLVWPHTLLNAAVAREIGRPVRTVLTRAQMYTSNGHRAEFHQRLRIGATRRGVLTGIEHTSTAQLSRTDQSVFNSSIATHTLYACPNVHVRQLGADLDLPTSSFMRSPELAAQFGLETALDELSHRTGVDPVDLRLRNHADAGPGKHLAECYRMGAAEFGWRRRERRPGATRDGDEYVGWGMATETHTYGNFEASARVTVGTDGRVQVAVATQEIGTGTYTVLSQVAADAVGVPLDRVTTRIGDTDLPPAGLSVASSTMPSVIPSVDRAGQDARAAVIRLAVADSRSPLHGVPPERVVTDRGRLVDSADPSRSDTYRAVVGRHGRAVPATAAVRNTPGHTYGAVFVEVRVHHRYGRVRVTRVVGAYDPGRVLNRRTLRGQVIGGVTWGIGYALTEHTVVDRATGRVVNPNLSTYLVPVNADAPPSVTALFVDQPDPGSAAMGAKGFGETPMTGVPAAIGNAIFHATGRRLREVPFTQDKLLL
ncbi:xanthine dehydrogenase family protein molybdopterin-binding subunit [Jidongwangia harbinensis]|uniref:xanthine dehydrogenase family protein molybdopterin-binding subunit n=1 Tax=Jidongwangia harbinensis TaxID=2878561 RepID=UPI001CD9D868|nr:xanthine dehydrogenase family protein molybdopterin-binding subunit [Jidongwangia harbinensis]MCA2216575.1 xanthine dehydrogenase family protein molybdopterin-binding subunit [Jidongwangia harbinensis]